MFDLVGVECNHPAALDADSFLFMLYETKTLTTTFTSDLEGFLYELPQTAFEHAYRELWHYHPFSGFLAQHRTCHAGLIGV